MRDIYKIFLIFISILFFFGVASRCEYSPQLNFANCIQTEIPSAKFVVEENRDYEIISKDLTESPEQVGNGNSAIGINFTKYFNAEGNFYKILAYEPHILQVSYYTINPRAP